VKRRFVLVHTEAREGAIEAVRTAPEGYQVVVEPQRRSLPQNALLHALFSLAEEQATFMGKRLAAEQWKIAFKSAHTIATGGKSDIQPGLEGEFLALYESTSGMDRARMSSLIDYTIAWLETQGVDTRRARGYAEHEIAA